jgi:hypothetical protein
MIHRMLFRSVTVKHNILEVSTMTRKTVYVLLVLTAFWTGGCSTGKEIIRGSSEHKAGDFLVSVEELVHYSNKDLKVFDNFVTPPAGSFFVWAPCRVKNTLDRDNQFSFERIRVVAGMKGMPDTTISPFVIIDSFLGKNMEANPHPNLGPQEDIERTAIFAIPEGYGVGEIITW